MSRTRRPARIGAFAAILAAMMASGAVAQDVTLSEAARLMAANEAQYRILDLEQDVAEELVRQARAERLPRVRIVVRYVQTQQDIISQDNQTFQEGTSSYPTTTIGLVATQPVWNAARFRALPLARAEEALVGAQAAAARTELASLLVRAFLDVARAELRVAQERAVVAARRQLARDLGALMAAGRADSGRQLQARGDVFAAEADLADAELDLAEALFELRRFTGPAVEGVTADGAFGVARAETFLSTFAPEQLAAMNPAVQVARGELDVAERQLARVRGSFQPTADLTAEFESETTEGSLFGGGSEVQSLDVGIELGWSIYEGGTRRSQRREARKRVEIAELRVAQAAELAARRYEALAAALRSSLDAVAATSRDQAAAARRASDARVELSSGRVSGDRVLEAELRRDVAGLQARLARLRTVEIQSQILALFGALDLDTLSTDFAGA
jgi:outer membrane protein TolC